MNNSGIQILLIDDDMSDAELTIREIRKSNIVNHLIHLKDGEEALDYLFGKGKYEGQNTSKQKSIVLLDLHMPKIGGVEVLEKIRTSVDTRHIPVVVLTSSSEYTDIEKCYLIGANSYIVKPVEFDGFMRAMKEVGLYWMLMDYVPAE